MNKVNPLHIITLLFVLVLFLFFQVQRTQAELTHERTLFLQSKELAQKTAAYKKLYSEKNKKSLKHILMPSFVKKANLQVKQNKNIFVISSPSISLSALNSFLSRIFNAAYRIQKLEIQKIDERTASLYLEIVW